MTMADRDWVKSMVLMAATATMDPMTTPEGTAMMVHQLMESHGRPFTIVDVYLFIQSVLIIIPPPPNWHYKMLIVFHIEKWI